MFKKDKDTIHKIANLIFIIWFITLAFMTVDNLADVLFAEKVMTYEEYTERNCAASNLNDECLHLYNKDKKNNNKERKDNQVELLNSVLNLAVVSGVLYFINNKKEIE